MSGEAPARRALREAEASIDSFGHSRDDHLSESHGFLPQPQPLDAMPESHRAWDQAAAQIPEMFRTRSAGRVLDELPLLSADPEHLDDAYVARASLVVGSLAHTYARHVDGFPAPLPDALEKPWVEITRRLGRHVPSLTATDFFAYNWRFIDPDRDDPYRQENFDLLVAIVGTPEEKLTWLTFLEILAQSRPAIGAAVRAQEAVLREDLGALECALLDILETVRLITFQSFFKIEPNPYSDYYADPVVWAQTVPSIAAPTREGELGLSGGSLPIFHLLDAIVGRDVHVSKYGADLREFYDEFPRNWGAFMRAVGEVSIRDFVAKTGDARLQGLFRTVLDAWAGERGYLGVHRLKLYTYIEMGVRSGRTGTNGGFSGTVRERSWENLDDDIDEARLERFSGMPKCVHYARVREVIDTSGSGDTSVRRVVLDIAGTGIVYEAGDRCGILPRNSQDLVDKTLLSLRANGDEEVRLDKCWREHMAALAPEEAPPESLPLRQFLEHAKIRPVLRPIGKKLLRLTGSRDLHEILEAHLEDQYELWDFVDLAGRGSFDPRRLWLADPWEEESLARIVPPESFRLYSISSAPDDQDGGLPAELHLTIGGLTYETKKSDGESETRRGAASNYLNDHLFPEGEPVAIQVLRPSKFQLPLDPSRPIAMFAAGTGISPFRGFWQERARQEGAGESWLFYGTRTPQTLHYQEELSECVREGGLKCRVAFSRADQRLRSVDGAGLLIEFAPRARIDGLFDDEIAAEALWKILASYADGGEEGRIYVCGQTAFAHTVHRVVKRVIERFHPQGAAAVDPVFRRLVGEGRLMHDIFTTFAPATAPGVLGDRLYDLSEVSEYNNDENGHRFVIDGNVYDMEEFRWLHPGGDKLIVAYAGSDATRAYEKVQHHLNSEVHAMLDMYKIGRIRRLRFGSAWGIALTDEGAIHVPLRDAFRLWVRYLFRAVELENMLVNNYTLRNSRLVAHEEERELSPLRADRLLDMHEDLLTTHIDDLLGDPLRRLWQITIGLCAHDENMNRLPSATAEAKESPEGRLCARSSLRGRKLSGGLQFPPSDGDRNDWRRLDSLLQGFEQADKAFAADLKRAIASGVKAFERWESKTIEQGGEQLVGSLLKVPEALAAYHSRITEALKEAALDSAV